MKLFFGLMTLFILTACNETPENRRNRTVIPVDRDFALGSSEEVSKYLISHSHRDSNLPTNSDIMSVYQEGLNLRANQYPSFYRDVPMVNLDTDNANIQITRPQVKCGTTGSGIQAKLDDCKAKNTSYSIHMGKTFGNMGEGDWQLVAKTENGSGGYEVWMDLRTRLVWSDRLEANNWCKASGNDEDEAGIDCASNTLDYCTADNLFQEQKGNSETIISWRLPSRNDFLQADINGARNVLPSRNYAYWTATVDSSNNAKAWTVHGKTGVLESFTRSSGAPSIRCIGRILK